jgi:hypothetical protein
MKSETIGRQPLQRHHLVDCHDAGVPQLRRCPRLAVEALQVLVGGQQAGVWDFERDDAVQLGVAGLPDGAEPAQADALQELELTQRPRRSGRGGVPGVTDAEGAAAAGAEHLVGLVVGELDGVVTVRAAQLPFHERFGVRARVAALRGGWK